MQAPDFSEESRETVPQKNYDEKLINNSKLKLNIYYKYDIKSVQSVYHCTIRGYNEKQTKGASVHIIV